MFSTISWLPISAIRSKPGHVLFACKVCDIRARHSEKSQVFHAFPPISEISRPVIFARNVRKFLVPSYVTLKREDAAILEIEAKCVFFGRSRWPHCLFWPGPSAKYLWVSSGVIVYRKNPPAIDFIGGKSII